MLPRLQQSLLVLVLSLQFLLLGYIADVSDDNQAAVFLVKFSGLDTNLEQDLTAINVIFCVT